MTFFLLIVLKQLPLIDTCLPVVDSLPHPGRAAWAPARDDVGRYIRRLLLLRLVLGQAALHSLEFVGIVDPIDIADSPAIELKRDRA